MSKGSGIGDRPQLGEVPFGLKDRCHGKNESLTVVIICTGPKTNKHYRKNSAWKARLSF